MTSVIFSVLVAVFIIGILSETEAVDPPCPCPRIYDPVCGKDGNNYPSPCDMKCSGVEEAYKGRCEERESRGSQYSQGEGDSAGNGGPATVSCGFYILTLVAVIQALRFGY